MMLREVGNGRQVTEETPMNEAKTLTKQVAEITQIERSEQMVNTWFAIG